MSRRRVQGKARAQMRQHSPGDCVDGARCCQPERHAPARRRPRRACAGRAQGLTLARPEVVPFRLTQNMIDGFGVAGQEGVFRRAAEITLQARALPACGDCAARWPHVIGK